MAKPFIHAKNSARKFGGIPSDYILIHDFMDSSKAAIADSRHRVLTHNTWFISNVIERVFGFTLVNSDGKEISTREIAEQHALEDYGNRYIPSAQDFLQNIEYEPWMNSGKGCPPSFAKIYNKVTKTSRVSKGSKESEKYGTNQRTITEGADDDI